MAKDIKTMFNNASSNTADFFSFSGDMDYPDRTIGDVLKESTKNFTSYGNRMDKYNAYLNTLKRLDVGLQKMSGKVATGVKAPASAGQVSGIKSTKFSDKVDEWNSRMRKFAVARYYAELGKK